jgi:hypothetical protein
MQRPLVLLYSSRPEGQPLPGEQFWKLVVPNGALMILKPNGSEAELQTGFFPSVTAAERVPERRWHQTVQYLVETYGEQTRDGYCQPHEEYSISVLNKKTGRGYVNNEICFVTLTGWGFVGERRAGPWRKTNLRKWQYGMGGESAG